MKLLLVTSPMIQVNTPYPATAYLKGFLDEHFTDGSLVTVQADPAIELITRLFSRTGLLQLGSSLPRKRPPELDFFASALADYCAQVEPVLAYLQGKNPGVEKKLAARKLVPEGPRFQGLHAAGPLREQFAQLSLPDKAQHVASLFLDDLADYYRLGADSRFEFARYGEKLAASQTSFDALAKNLAARPSLVDRFLDEVTRDLLARHAPDVVGISVPFAGTVYAALRMGARARAAGLPVILGGGYANTELRRLTDARVFDYVDYITLDDGERPLLCLLEHLQGRRPRAELFRTYYREDQQVRYAHNRQETDIPFRDSGTPSYAGLPLDRYIPLYEMLNPVTRLWSGYFWNKLTLAHGCYWRRCSFCDVSLDYIGRYETDKAARLCDKMEKIAAQTGRRGFHFVDEAAPPAVLRALSEELLRRRLQFTWWGNIRFEKSFTPALTALMAAAGCITVTGGLEVASPRVLALIEKGVTIEQVARVTRAFSRSGILVHAYLMFGFPTQTEQETVDSLEVVRQLFVHGCLKSAFWHRFAATVHSPVGRNPEKYGIRALPQAPGPAGRFAENDVDFRDPTPAAHELLGEGLKRALYNYMHGVGLELDVREFFPRRVPRTRVAPTLIARALEDADADADAASAEVAAVSSQAAVPSG